MSKSLDQSHVIFSIDDQKKNLPESNTNETDEENFPVSLFSDNSVSNNSLSDCEEDKYIFENECSICFENLDSNVALLECCHKFHLKCIEKWYQNRIDKKIEPKCPICDYNSGLSAILFPDIEQEVIEEFDNSEKDNIKMKKKKKNHNINSSKIRSRNKKKNKKK